MRTHQPRYIQPTLPDMFPTQLSLMQPPMEPEPTDHAGLIRQIFAITTSDRPTAIRIYRHIRAVYAAETITALDDDQLATLLQLITTGEVAV